VTLDGRSRAIRVRARRRRAREVLYRAKLSRGRHRLAVRVLGGELPLEGLAIANRRR